MERTNTEWATAEQMTQFKTAYKHVNITAVAKKYGTTRHKVYKFLSGKLQKVTHVAPVMLALSDAVAEYQRACKTIQEATQQ
ncbi:hypothetical protein HF324_18570 [Chitinophaga oryzae]|uniref:HTH psq-type domain-containing protein n=1 Tax=Chitinophaga oryzae TaxID=2725414 RepID=A0ABX6LJ05_9BACT|nr:hypothetical protein [Chitinophaga oryzae]QJB39753.1 hypothetical protein HF324_18570 [Chitinophaga oryzae]